jgi:hypothetical protein
VTPPAAQGASFQENSRPDTRAIMKRILFDIKNNAGSQELDTSRIADNDKISALTIKMKRPTCLGEPLKRL